MNNNIDNILTCPKCGQIIQSTDKFCIKCGSPVNTVVVTPTANTKTIVKASDFDWMYSESELTFLETYITRELDKIGIGKNNTLVPEDVLRRKKILSIIYAVLLFVYVCLFFFHFPWYTYVIGLIILAIFRKITKKFNLVKYLKKEIMSRPSEKMTNIIMNAKNSLVVDNFKMLRIVSILVALILPLIIFIKPVILYEKVDGGYAVRYYAFGVTNFTSAEIPATHNGENVVSLRGNTFSNMPLLRTVTLPDTITEIRGQAFMNCLTLTSVNIPSNLEYLGGGAFYNATSITEITLPDSLTYLGGEAFYGAISLKSVRLSNNLTEIRGDSFEYCTSLEEITIPDSVTRIGGHAFYGDSALSRVIISPNNKLKEIGSSAFRSCPSLSSITISRNTYVNSRAFKESPTVIYYYD